MAPLYALGALRAEDRDAATHDAFPYGLRASRDVVETIARYLHEQGLTPRVVALEEIFAPSTLPL
jgi:4,5-dihydroxyphthalate decarboxylase